MRATLLLAAFAAFAAPATALRGPAPKAEQDAAAAAVKAVKDAMAAVRLKQKLVADCQLEAPIPRDAKDAVGGLWSLQSTSKREVVVADGHVFETSTGSR